MNTFDAIWKKLRRSKRYREQFVADHAKRAVPHQARSIMKAKKLSQRELAKRSGLSQGAVSRAVDPSYGNLTLTTIIRLAAGFDLAFVGRFVPFSDLAKWYADLPDENFNIPNFSEEDSFIGQGVPLDLAPSGQIDTGHLLQGFMKHDQWNQARPVRLPSLEEALAHRVQRAKREKSAEDIPGISQAGPIGLGPNQQAANSRRLGSQAA